MITLEYGSLNTPFQIHFGDNTDSAFEALKMLCPNGYAKIFDENGQAWMYLGIQTTLPVMLHGSGTTWDVAIQAQDSYLPNCSQ